MADLAERPTAAAVRSLGELALAAVDRNRGTSCALPGGRRSPTPSSAARSVRSPAGWPRWAWFPATAWHPAGRDRPGVDARRLRLFCAGATVVPVYHTNSPEECEYVLSHSGAKGSCVEDAAQAAKIATVRGALPELEHVVVLTGEAEGAITLADLRSRGDAGSVEERIAAIAPEDTATIVYTSGTTGPPKGCVLSHANLLFTAGTYIDRLNLRTKPPVIFQYLPLAHVLARMVSFVTLETGGTLAFWGGDTKNIAKDIAEAEPTHIPTVPRLLEKIHTRVSAAPRPRAGRRPRSSPARWRPAQGRQGQARGPQGRHARQGPPRRRRQARALEGPRRARAQRPGPDHRRGADQRRGDRVLLRLRRARARGLRDDGDVRRGDAEHPQGGQVGSVGRPLPGTEVSIAEDGEVLMQGPHIFKGYHRNPEATEAILEGGWLHSGDLGEIVDGYVRITGRKKDLIITSAGRTSRPSCWRARCARPAGSRRRSSPATSAPTSSRSSRWIRTRAEAGRELGVSADPESMAADEKVRETVWKDIDAVNQRFARIEQIKRFAILPRDLSQEEGELTPTLKVKRAVVYKKYQPTSTRSTRRSRNYGAGSRLRHISAVIALLVAPAAQAAGPHYDVPSGYTRCAHATGWHGFFKWASTRHATCRQAATSCAPTPPRPKRARCRARSATTGAVNPPRCRG